MYDIDKMPSSIDVGYTGETNVNSIQINMAPWVSKVPGGSPKILYMRPGESEASLATTTFENNVLTWSITDDVLGTKEGTGLFQVWFADTDEEEELRKLGMSVVVSMIIHLSIAGEGGNASTVQLPWLKEIMDLKNIILGYDYEAEAWAVGQSGGVDVPDTNPAYNNHAKHYSEESAKWATGGTTGTPGATNNAKYYSEQADAAKVAAQTAQAACETEVTRQLSEIISNPDSPPLDRTLSSNVSAAPADMVGDLKSAANSYLTKSEKEYLTEWSQGTINGTTGAIAESTTRCRLSSYMQFEDKKGNAICITIKSGYKVSARIYSSNTSSSYISGTSFATNGIERFEINPNYYYKFVIAKTDDSTLAPSDLPSDVFAYQYIELFDETLTVKGMAADAKKVGDTINSIANAKNLIENTLYPAANPLDKRPSIGGTMPIYKKGGNLVVLSSAEHGIKVTSKDVSHIPVLAFVSDSELLDNGGLDVDTYYTLSFDVKYKLFSNDTANQRYLSIYVDEATSGEELIDMLVITSGTATTSKSIVTVPKSDYGTEKTARAEFTFKLGSTTKKFEIVVRGSTTTNTNYDYGDYIECKNMMLQIGEKATNWTPNDKDYNQSEPNTIVGRNNIVDTTLKLQQLNRPTRTGSRTLGTPPLCLLHFSDIHGDGSCLSNIVEFKNNYSEYIADIIHTGDSVTTTFADGMTFWDNVDGSEKILNVIGNHDTRVGTTWIGKTMAESYEAYFAPYIENWGAVYTTNKTYYYKDYSENKVRLIILDIMHQDAEQLSWFIDTLADANANELHVMALVHSRAGWVFDSYDTPWDDKPIVPGGYHNGTYTDTSDTSYPENLSDAYASAVDDFIEGGGYFICWLHGHTHFKMFAKLHSHPNQLNVSVANAGGTDYAWTYVWARIQNTRSEDDFNVLAIDTYSKILRIAKFGVNYDRFMRNVDTISYNYETGELLYSN